ncbi:TPA: hypothetical protein ACJJ40_002132, partial [Neisseria meningitidis]
MKIFWRIFMRQISLTDYFCKGLNPFYRIGNSKKNPFHSHAGKPVFDFGYFWLFRVIYESSFPRRRESRHSMLRQF